MKLSYRYKGVIYLILLLIVLPWLAGRYALTGTISAWLDCRKLEAMQHQLQTTDTENSIPENFAADMLLNGKLLSELQPATEEQHVVIGDYRPLVTTSAEGIEVHTAALVLEGAFANILHIVKYIERKITPCKISSLHLGTVTSTGENGQRLEATLYVEQIVQTRR